MIFLKNFWRLKKKYLNYFRSNQIQINDYFNFGTKEANEYFKKKLNNCKFYFEYGSGSSTLYVDKKFKKYISIETDKSFYSLIKTKLKKKNSLKFMSLGLVGEFSYPFYVNKNKIKSYVESIDIFIHKKSFPDLILIDGRFRVACCLNLLKFKEIINNKSIIILDDFRKRENYKVLKRYFSIKMVGRFGILKVKKYTKTKNNFIEKYYKDCT